MAFADNVRFYLTKKMTQGRLAERVNRNPCTVSRWLSGEIIPRLPTITIVADVLGVAVYDLLKDGPRIMASK